MRKRTKARECALQILYQVDITKNKFQDSIDDFWETKGKFDDSIKDFAQCLVSGTVENLKELDSVISRSATNWEIDRMATVDRNILRLASYELLFMDDIPLNVSINEAIEMAKRYGDKESGKFVNGILDKISKEEKRNAR